MYESIHSEKKEWLVDTMASLKQTSWSLTTTSVRSTTHTRTSGWECGWRCWWWIHRDRGELDSDERVSGVAVGWREAHPWCVREMLKEASEVATTESATVLLVERVESWDDDWWSEEDLWFSSAHFEASFSFFFSLNWESFFFRYFSYSYFFFSSIWYIYSNISCTISWVGGRGVG